MPYQGERQTFMFVNEQPLVEGSGRRSRDQKSAILSYAQTRRRDREKRAQGAGSGKDAQEDHLARALIKASPVNSIGDALSQIQPAPALSQSYPTDNGLDPFYCTIAGKDGRALSYLKDALGQVELGTFLAESLAPPHAVQGNALNRSRNAVIKLQHRAKLRQCVSDPMVMYSTLAFGSTYLGWTRGEFYNTEIIGYYIGKTLESVRLRVTDTSFTPDLWLLYSIWALAVTEMWNGMSDIWFGNPLKLETVDHSRLETSRTHLRALCSLVERLDGWMNVDFFLLQHCILTDKFLALSSGKMPIIPLTWDPGPCPKNESFGDRTKLSPVLLSGWRYVHVPESQPLKQLVADIIDYIKRAELAWQQVPATSTAEWLFLRNQALLYQLILMQDISLIDDCIRWALLGFLLISAEYKGAQLAASMNSKRLRKKIAEAMRLESQTDYNVMFWCACMGAMSCDSRDDGSQFIQLAGRLAQKLGVAPTYETFQRVLNGFLFWESKQGNKLIELIEQISERGDPNIRILAANPIMSYRTDPSS